ncbi:pimeloyl-ACP methyl ester carboxylesterase [Bacillus fengqiuensis]|nr:pimeloyl-ACP methyl ester carboxylesterase [Bacillus fengqiuensis]
MGVYVLVHGAFHGAWCWDKVVPLLEEDGHHVIAIDLPGHGRDDTPPAQVTMQSYRDTVCHVLDELNEKAILVGHSMGGLVISSAAEKRPEKIDRLVYIASHIPDQEQSLFQLSTNDPEALPLPAVLSTDQSYLQLDVSVIKANFYGECSNEDVAMAQQKIGIQPIAPIMASVRLTKERFSSIPKVYIETLKDKAISTACQRASYTKTPCQVITMDTDHSPFLSKPFELAMHLKGKFL